MVTMQAAVYTLFMTDSSTQSICSSGPLWLMQKRYLLVYEFSEIPKTNP